MGDGFADQLLAGRRRPPGGFEQIDEPVARPDEVDRGVDERVVQVEDEGDLARGPHAAEGFVSRTGNSLSRMIAEGTTAPTFTLPDDTGAPVRLSEFRGRRIVLWFYVRDDTPG